jgi:putative endonuclease
MQSEKTFSVYLLASKRNGTLYTGFTSDLPGRVYQHETKTIRGFTTRYNVIQLVYHERFADAYTAIQREKQLKKWNRAWKIRLIEKHNPEWKDLYNDGEILLLPR